MTSKIIQISAVHVRGSGVVVFALCEDGTLWRGTGLATTDFFWQEIPAR